jgi:hypothetical protein
MVAAAALLAANGGGAGEALPPLMLRRPGLQVALVGKALCFDSGGYNLKTQGGIELMKVGKWGLINMRCTPSPHIQCCLLPSMAGTQWV